MTTHTQIRHDALIRDWMRLNEWRFKDKITGEVNMTLMVETWDIEMQDGAATLRSDHPAWEVARR